MHEGLLSLSDREFSLFQRLIFERAGISMGPAKRALIAGRLTKRLKALGLGSFADYHAYLTQRGNEGELQQAVDLLTTNETYFFREPKHFDFLREQILPKANTTRPLRIWSAACSSGEEVYALAMVLAEHHAGAWEILGSDISQRVLAQARSAHYPIDRAEDIAPALLKKYCLKGIGAQQGSFLVDKPLRSKVRFESINLNEPLPRVGEFDVIFLRNVMIYFDMATKREVVERLVAQLRPGGYFIVSHSESLNGVTETLRVVSPSIYRKP